MKDKRLASLVNRAQKGDIEAFEELYSEHARSILFHVRNLIYDKENYRDVAQEVALRIYEQIGSLRKPAAFRGWMHQIVRNESANHNRSYLRALKHQNTGDAEEYLLTIVDESEDIDPEAAWDNKLEGNLVYAAVTDLKPEFREVLLLRFYDDLSYKEIAEALEVSLDVVKVRLHRAIKAARNAMKERADKERNEAFSTGDKQTKKSLSSAVAVLVPAEVVKLHIDELSDKLAAAGAPVVVQQVVASNSVSLLSKPLLAITTAALVLALAGGYFGITWYMETVTETVTEGNGVVEETFTYQGDAHIVFLDLKGEDTQNGVIAISIVDDTGHLARVSYEISREGGDVIFSGDTKEVSPDELAQLLPGLYRAVFTVTDENDASVIVSRSFKIK